jgi:hypothetical protein
MGPKCVWASSSIFFEKKMNQAKGRQGNKEAGSTFVLHANNNYGHIICTQLALLQGSAKVMAKIIAIWYMNGRNL